MRNVKSDIVESREKILMIGIDSESRRRISRIAVRTGESRSLAFMRPSVLRRNGLRSEGTDSMKTDKRAGGRETWRVPGCRAKPEAAEYNPSKEIAAIVPLTQGYSRANRVLPWLRRPLLRSQ